MRTLRIALRALTLYDITNRNRVFFKKRSCLRLRDRTTAFHNFSKFIEKFRTLIRIQRDTVTDAVNGDICFCLRKAKREHK